MREMEAEEPDDTTPRERSRVEEAFLHLLSVVQTMVRSNTPRSPMDLTKMAEAYQRLGGFAVDNWPEIQLGLRMVYKDRLSREANAEWSPPEMWGTRPDV